MRKTAVIIPCFKRPEYTNHCINAMERAQVYRDVDFFLVDDCSNDSTYEILQTANLPIKRLIRHSEPQGLRNIIIDFFNAVKDQGYVYLAKMDNDCLVPENWLNQLIDVLEKTEMDIVSPNVLPSNAAFELGKDGELVRPSDHVGGLWCMKTTLIESMTFEKYAPNGITGAFNILKQIIAENDAKCGWVPSVTVQDVGHWSGYHPLHIKSKEHEEYSAVIGRGVSWVGK